MNSYYLRSNQQQVDQSHNVEPESQSARHIRHRTMQEKIAERESRSNIQQMYLPPPIKGPDKIGENDIAGTNNLFIYYDLKYTRKLNFVISTCGLVTSRLFNKMFLNINR